MAKKKAIKNVIAEQIKALIDAGDFAGAQALISGEVQNRAPTSPKKRGRPPKQVKQVKRVEQPQEIAPPRPSSSANSGNSSNTSSCIAPSKRVDVSPESRKVEKDGKTYTASIKVPWTAPKKITFKEDKSVERNPGLKYPERVAPRDPAEQIEYICNRCDRKVYLYPGQGPDEDMFFLCDNCLKKNRGR